MRAASILFGRARRGGQHRKASRLFVHTVAVSALVGSFVGAGVIAASPAHANVTTNFFDATNHDVAPTPADLTGGILDWANSGALTSSTTIGGTWTRAGSNGVFNGGKYQGTTVPPTPPGLTTTASNDTAITNADFLVDPLSGDGPYTCNGANGPVTVSGDTTTFTGAGSETNDGVIGSFTYGTAGNTPAKDELSNVYALSHQTTGVNEVFFGGERVVNNGDSHIDFEFLQANVGIPDPCAAGTFSGHRTQGDLILSVDFTNGGTLGGIDFRVWSCNGSTTLDTSFNGKVCDPPANGNPGKGDPQYVAEGSTGIAEFGVNSQGAITCGGWVCRNSNGTSTTQLLTNSFMEGGIDLNAAGFHGCFSTFLPHTRASQSFTAVLKDFAGPIAFSNCKPAPTTTTPSATTIVLGHSVHDTAVVQGNAAGGSPAGTVTFFECGPLQSATGCQTGGTQLGTDGVTLTAGANNTSSADSIDFTPTAVGTYCFRGEYSGAEPYLATSDGRTTECFTVTKIPTSTATTPSDTSINLGASVTDTAVVSGNATGGSPTGHVDFFVCGPSATNCTSGGTALSSDVSLTAGVNNNSSATSDSYTPSAPGTYCFRAVYSGDSNYLGSSDGSSTECFTVNKAPTTTVTTPSSQDLTLGDSVTDTAVVSGNATGGSPTGHVDFFVCGPSATDCTSGGTPLGSDVSLTAGANDTSSADSDSYTPSAPGTYCFRAVYSGDTNYAESSDGSSTECFTVTKAPSSTVTNPSETSITLGDSLTDTAVVSGNATGGSPTGHVDFFVCGPSASDCTSGGTALGSDVSLTAGANDTSSATSDSYTPSAPGTYCFRAVYSGDSNYLGSSDGSSTECFTVNKAPTTTVTTPSETSITLGDSLTDSAVVSGNATGGSPTGHVDFFVCGPSASDCTSGGTALGSDVSLTAGANNKSSATSDSYTPSAPGTYCFRAEYSGDSNYLGSSDGSSTECFTVGQAPSSTVTTPSETSITLGDSVTDSAVVTGNTGGPAPTGSVQFYVCGPQSGLSSCDSTTGTALGSAVSLTADVDPSKADASSTSFTPDSTGDYCFAAVYGGDTNYSGSSDGSSTECFTVNKAPTDTVTTPGSTTLQLGQSLTDTAVVSGNTGGPTPTGSVTFYVCGPQAAATGCSSTTTQVGNAVTVSAGQDSTASATSDSFTPSAVGIYCFYAVYGGDTNYTGSSDGSDTECFTVENPVTTAQIMPTQTTCQQYLAGATPLAFTEYSVKGGTIRQADPGVLFYYNQLTAPSSSFAVDVTQAVTSGNFQRLYGTMQIMVYDAACNTYKSVTITSTSPADVKVSITNATAGATYVISVKYSVNSVVGVKAPTPTTVVYGWSMALNGSTVSGSDASISMYKK